MSDKETEDAYRLLYKQYDLVMKQYKEYQRLVKIMQAQLKEQLEKKYPKEKDPYQSLHDLKIQYEIYDSQIENGVEGWKP